MFAVSKKGLWYFVGTGSEPASTLKMMRFSDRTTHEVARLDFTPAVANNSVSSDEQSVLVTKLDRTGTDLFIVNDFK